MNNILSKACYEQPSVSSKEKWPFKQGATHGEHLLFWVSFKLPVARNVRLVDHRCSQQVLFYIDLIYCN